MDELKPVGGWSEWNGCAKETTIILVICKRIANWNAFVDENLSSYIKLKSRKSVADGTVISAEMQNAENFIFFILQSGSFVIILLLFFWREKKWFSRTKTLYNLNITLGKRCELISANLFITKFVIFVAVGLRVIVTPRVCWYLRCLQCKIDFAVITNTHNRVEFYQLKFVAAFYHDQQKVFSSISWMCYSWRIIDV